MSTDLVERKIDGRLPASNPGTFGAFLSQRKSAIGAVAASIITPERLTKIVLRCVVMNPQLQRCTMDSIFRSALMAAELGLEPGSALGEAYLVPYKDTCQMIPGYRGLITLARRSGQVLDIYAHAVYQGDTFTVELGTEGRIEHIPQFGAREDKDLVYVYAVAKLVGGASHFDVMTRADVDRIRARSAAGRSGPWVTDYVEMAKKTVIRRLCKLLPMSVEMSKAQSLEIARETGNFQGVEFECLTEGDIEQIEATEAPAQIESAPDPTKGAEALKDKLKTNGHAKAEPEPLKPSDISDAEKAAILEEERRAAKRASDDLSLEIPGQAATAESKSTLAAMDR